MPTSPALVSPSFQPHNPEAQTLEDFGSSPRKPPQSTSGFDPLMTVDDVALRLKVSKDWVWDHSSRKTPHLPVIRMGDGTLRYRASAIEAFIAERERVSAIRYGRR
jgi:hypothetical protein